MKKRMKKSGVLLLCVVFLAAVSGCGVKTAAAGMGNAADGTMPDAAVVSEEEDAEAKELLQEYFSILFDVPSVDIYTNNTRTGMIPEEIHGYIAGQTMAEGDGNPEVGIHLPRPIGINGMTTVGYETVKLPDKKNEDITSGLIAKNGDNLLYYSKVKVKAKVLPDDAFTKAFFQQSDNTYTKRSEFDSLPVDSVKVEIRYDVELTRDNGKLKILRAVESSMKPGVKNRTFRMNNENVTRIPYLDTTLAPDGSGYNNPADGEIYEAEKKVIHAFFTNLMMLDRERMNLLSYKWEQGAYHVQEYWDSLGITADSENGGEVIRITTEYNENCPYNSLPLRYDMERINKMEKINVMLHPAYSEKQKWYFVQFDAAVQKMNGITDENFLYRYDYWVILSETEGVLMIEKIKLNEYYPVSK